MEKIFGTPRNFLGFGCDIVQIVISDYHWEALTVKDNYLNFLSQLVSLFIVA
jgi:uncharacterized protein YjaG (DUF416 family)